MIRFCSYHGSIKSSSSCEPEVAASFPCGSDAASTLSCETAGSVSSCEATDSAYPHGSADPALSFKSVVSTYPCGPADSTFSFKSVVSTYPCGSADSTSSFELAVSVLSCETTDDRNRSNMRTRISPISFPLRGPKLDNLKTLSRPLGTASSLILLSMNVLVQEHQTTCSKLFKHRYLNAFECKGFSSITYLKLIVNP
jgi:hypothetical protein